MLLLNFKIIKIIFYIIYFFDIPEYVNLKLQTNMTLLPLAIN